jgi:hypothetical protein
MNTSLLPTATAKNGESIRERRLLSIANVMFGQADIKLYF